jgi:ribosomal protein S18 acetylase RimI-like enzyme
MDAAVPPGATPADAVQEVREHFRAAGASCRQWFMNPAAAESQTRPLADCLAAGGWTPRTFDVMYRAGQSAARVAETPGLTIIPARASFRHARELAEEAAAESSERQGADADMLHLDDPHWDAAVALLDGRAVARAGVLAVGDVGRVEDVYVGAAHRRRGIGRTMMGRAMEVCARSLFKHVLLRVRPDDAAAVGLCTGFGFRTIGRMIAYEAPAEE